MTTFLFCESAGARALAAAQRRAGRGGGLTSDDERESVASDMSFLSQETFEASTPAGVEETTAPGAGAAASSRNNGDFADLLEKLNEKRTTAREDCLRELIAGLRSYTFVDQAIANRESVFSSLVGLLRRSRETEGVLCAEALGMMMLLIGPEEDEIFNLVRAPLEFVITRGQSERMRIEATRALALGSFICNTEEERTLAHLAFFEALFTGESEGGRASEELKAAGVDAWSLLFTVAPRGYNTHESRALLLENFLHLLDASSADLRVAAGEAIALLREHWRQEGLAVHDVSADEEEVVDSIVDRLQDMAREGSKRMSRKDKKAQRASFREICSAVVDGQRPEEVISYRTRSFRLTSWVKMKQVEALRDCLQGGFLTALAQNTVIHDIFDLDPTAFDVPVERSVVAKNSELGRWRTTTRSRNRRSREKAKHHFTEEGEDA